MLDPDDRQRHLFELDLHGYTIVKNVLSPAEINNLRDKTQALADSPVGTEHRHKGSARHVGNLPVLDQSFHPLIDHPKVLPLVEAVLGQQIILGSLNARLVRPGDPVQGLHADIPACLQRPGNPIMVNTVWMLVDFTHEMGATRVVPGSHRYAGAVSDGEAQVVVEAEAPAGSVLVFNGQCWHGGGANTTADQTRVALFGHYRISPWIDFQWDPRPDFPSEWLASLSPRQQALMRLDGALADVY